jgi:hypothetical protein
MLEDRMMEMWATTCPLKKNFFVALLQMVDLVCRSIGSEKMARVAIVRFLWGFGGR